MPGASRLERNVTFVPGRVTDYRSASTTWIAWAAWADTVPDL